MCECTSCPSPLFLAASCSDPGVCSLSFLCCPNRAQASSVSSSFVTFTQPMDVCFACAHMRRVHVWNRCEAEPDVKKLFKEFRLCVSTRESPCVPKHGLTPLRSETDKRGHEEIFPHDDVTAWEKKTALSDSSFCFESVRLVFPFWIFPLLWLPRFCFFFSKCILRCIKHILKLESLHWTVLGGATFTSRYSPDMIWSHCSGSSWSVIDHLITDSLCEGAEFWWPLCCCDPCTACLFTALVPQSLFSCFVIWIKRNPVPNPAKQQREKKNQMQFQRNTKRDSCNSRTFSKMPNLSCSRWFCNIVRSYYIRNSSDPVWLN